MRLLLSGDEASEREEREADVAGDAELAGRLEGIRREGSWGRKIWERGGTGEQRRGKASRRDIRELIPAEDRVLYCHQPSSKLCV